MVNKEFIKSLNLFEQIVLCFCVYLFVIIAIVSNLVVAGFNAVVRAIKWIRVHIAQWFDKCVRTIARNGYFYSLSEYNMANLRKGVAITIAFIVSISLLIGGVAIRNNIQKEKYQSAMMNVEFEYVVGSETTNVENDEYHTWWDIAEEYCPSFMIISNFGEKETNYLKLLYYYNGGAHELQRGEVVKVPILE